MNELIRAAKAVIAEWDDRQVVGDRKLRAAVERAEKQEAVGFEEWWNEHVAFDEPHRKANDRKTWIAATQAERERIKDIIKTVGVQCDNGTWVKCETIMEKIDAPDA